MKISELINEIITEWSYRVENGMPDATNPMHLVHLGIVLKEMGLPHIKPALIENLLMEKGKTPEKVAEAEKGNFTNPILNKSIKYKNANGEDKEGLVGNLLRLPADHPGRKAAEALLPADGSPERDALNKDLGGQGQAVKPEDGEDKEGGEAAPKEDPAKAAQAMFDPKADPAMAARMDKEKDVQAKLAKDAEEDKEVEKEQEPKEDGGFNPIDSKDVAKEMPEADPETFAGGSDIPDGVTPEELEQFNTDIKKVAQQVADAKAKGEPAPNINLCDVTVPGTNLYCDDNLGIPRDEMPQFKGNASPGSRAASMDVDASGEVDTEPVFKEMLKEKGIKTLQTEVPADKLKATQKDLVGAKVVGMMGALEKDPNHPKITAPIYVSRDGYVIDGHHRWAAVVAYNAANPGKQIQMKTTVLDQDIKDAIPMANKFAEDMGIAAKKADANKETPPTEQPAKKQPDVVANELKGRTTSEGEELDVEKTKNGSLIIGIEHGEGTESTKETINKITSLPKDTKVMFVGEGGMSKDDNGNIEFAGEQDEFRNAVKGHFNDSEESSWDENANVFDDNSPVYDEVAKSFGGNKSKAKASIWSNMYGQDGVDSGMDANDYLDEEGKQWIIDQAQKGGAKSINANTDFNNLTDEEQTDLYELNFRDDDSYGETEMSKGQQSYNSFRQNELDRKIKEAESNGYTVIAPVGNSHVDMYRNRSKGTTVEQTSKLKEEHLHLVDELMLEMIYGFIAEAIYPKSDDGKFWVKSKRNGNVYTVITPKSALHDIPTETDIKTAQTDSDKDKKGTDGVQTVKGAELFDDPEYQKGRETPTTGKHKKGDSLKDAYLGNSKAAKSEKAQEDFEKRRQKSLSQIDKAAEYNSDEPGIFKLETEQGSGKFVEIKTEDVKIAINKLFDGEKLSANDKKNLLLTTKIVTNPENGDVKLYFAKKIAGRHPQQGYESVLMAEKNIPMGDAFRAYAIENGLKVGKSGEGAFGKKQINPLKTAKGGNPKEPIKNLNVKSDKNGIEVNGKRFNYRPIPTESELNKLREKLLKRGTSPEEADERVRILVNTRKKEKQVLSTIAEVAAKTGGEIPYCNFGDVFTPEGRKATITNVITGVTKMFTDGLTSHQNTFNTDNLLENPENKKIFDTLKKLEKISKSSNLETDKEGQLAFKTELNQLLIDMAESVDFKDSVADFAEMVVGLEELSKGRRVMFPSAENFQTADIIVLPSDESISDADLVNVSIEELDLTGGVSIKSDGGGGSALKNRIELTEYKTPETKQKLLNALVTHQVAYGNQQDVKEEELVKAKSKIDDLFNYGVEIGCFDESQKEIIKKIGEKQGQSEIKTAGDAGNCGGKENQKRLHEAIILQHQQLQLTCIISNCDTDWTGYSNVNKKYSKKKGKVVKVTDDVADGVKKPCYSSPHHNPGYTKSVDNNGCVSLTPTNQNPAHIVSKIPDLINNFKE